MRASGQLYKLIDLSQFPINNGESDESGRANTKEKIVPPWRIDICQHAKSCTAVGDIDQIKKSRNNFPGFIQVQRVDNQRFGQLISSNCDDYDNKIHHLIYTTLSASGLGRHIGQNIRTPAADFRVLLIFPNRSRPYPAPQTFLAGCRLNLNGKTRILFTGKPHPNLRSIIC